MANEIIIPRAIPQIKTEETTMPYSKPKTTKKKTTKKKKKKSTPGKKKSY